MYRNLSKGRSAQSQQGFTLVETLVAMVVFIFGIMAVTNLLIVAGTTNSVAKQSSAAAAAATQVMDILKTTTWEHLNPGGNLNGDSGPTTDCLALGSSTAAGSTFNCDSAVAGVGRIHSRWQISTVPASARLYFIEVRSEPETALGGQRARAFFSTFRSCTDSRASTGAGAVAPCPL